MSVTMNKELLIRMPSSLYKETIKLCKKRYMSISSFIRELIVEQIESSLTPEEEKIVAEGERQYLKGKGTNWRKIKRVKLGTATILDRKYLLSKRRGYMAEGEFVVKFDGKEVARCYAVAFDYDDWQCVINGTDKKELPAGVETITIEVERR